MRGYINADAMNAMASIDSESVQTCITSPPYWGLRDYGVEGQLGLEKTPDEFVERLVNIFKEVKRVLKKDGTLWLNLGDSYCGGGNNRGNKSAISNKQASNRGAIGQVAKYGIHNFKSPTIKPKDLVGIPWRVAFALQADGWYLRQDIIWHKPNPMPESVRDRCTKSHEYIFLLSKSKKYYFDNEAIKEPAFSPDGQRNKRSVWTVTTKPFKGAHFATFPPDLIEPCVLAGSKINDIILDPFFGAGTVGLVAKKHDRNFIGIEINQDYMAIAKERIGL